jgi:acetyl esterase/lipase
MKLKTFLLLLVPIVGLIAFALIKPVAALNVLAVGGSYQLVADVAYGSLTRQKLDVYQPSAAAPLGGYPTVVFFYGGSWNRGDRADYKFVAAALASRGVLTFVADYRLYPEVRYPDFLNDSAQALAFGLENAMQYKGNPKKVFVMGHSAGAYNAAMLAFDARWLQSVKHSPAELAGFIGIAGPYNFLPMTNPDTQPVFFHPNYPSGSQPIDYVSRTSPRSFLGAAAVDPLVVPQRNTVVLAERLTAAGNAPVLKLYDRVNHMTIIASFAAPLRWMAPVFDDVIGFIQSAP